MSCSRVALALVVTAVACGGEKQSSSAPVFGGEGAVIASPDEKPLPQEEAQADSGPCGKHAPPGDVKLLEDFEDGDAKLFKAFQREGWWHSATDNTQGSSIHPSGAFAAELLAAPESTKENRYAAHLKASGQTQWGVVWGTSLNWVNQGIRCPFNASKFAGVRFRAKGPGTVRVNVSIPETIPPEHGGNCKQGCYDNYHKVVLLNDKWDDYTVLWEKLQQGGWGTEARFDPTRVIGLSFAASPKELPIEFWLDDIEFIEAAR